MLIVVDTLLIEIFTYQYNFAIIFTSNNISGNSFRLANMRAKYDVTNQCPVIWAAFRYSLRVLNIYSARYVCYRFWALAVNIGTHPWERFSSIQHKMAATGYCTEWDEMRTQPLPPVSLCRTTITNQALVDREGTFILLSASHSTRPHSPPPLSTIHSICRCILLIKLQLWKWMWCESVLKSCHGGGIHLHDLIGSFSIEMYMFLWFKFI